jgi:rubrerythrin
VENVIDIKQETQDLVKQVDSFDKAIIIKSNVDYERVGEELKQIKTLFNALENERKSATKPLDEAKKKIMDWFRQPSEKLTIAEANRKRAMIGYQQEQEKKRREEEARLAELQRKEAERLAKKAAEAEAKGRTEKAEELRQQAQEASTIAPIVPPKVEKINGIKTMKIWKFRIVNEKLIPRDYLMPDEKKIGAITKATKGTLEIPGIEIYPEDTMAV